MDLDPDDDTVLIDMKKNFKRFISDDDSRKRSRLDLSESLLDSSHTSIGNNLSRDSRVTQAELLYCKSRVSMLESHLANREAELKEQAILHDQDISKLKQIHDRELRGYSVLKTSHERVLHRLDLCEDELKEEKLMMENTKEAFEEEIRQLQQRNLDQDVFYTQQVEEQKLKYRELRNKYINQQGELSVVNSELSRFKEQHAELKQKLNDSQNSNADGEGWKEKAQAAEQALAKAMQDLDRYRDDMQVMAARKKDLVKLVQISDDNSKLKQQTEFYKMTVGNVEVLREEVNTLQRKLQNHEELQDRLARVEVENEDYNRRFDELRRVPEDVIVRLREAQEKEAVMLENVGDLKSRNRLLESRVQQLEATGNGLQSKLSGADGETAKMAAKVDKLHRKIILLTKERDGYKQILDSYESEVTREVIPINNDKLSQLQQMVNCYVKVNEELEKKLHDVEQENITLKQTVKDIECSAAGQPAAAVPLESAASKVDQNQLVELRKMVEELEKRCETVTEERDVLEARIEQRNLQGDYDPTKTKVVHLTMNPADQAQRSRAAEVKSLLTENARLYERIKVLQKNLSEAHDITVQVDANLQAPSAQINEELKALKDKLASSEKKYERLMEVCRKTSLEFRQVVYQLTGFRIDIPRTKQYKLMHMYSNSPNDFLLFQESGEGDLQLLETDYAQTLTELAEEHLHSNHSIPVFLSSLTIDLYKQSTMCASMM